MRKHSNPIGARSGPAGLHRRGFLGAALALVVAPAATAGEAVPAPRVRIVVDPNTGLAIGGHDPVCYFTERRPMLGHERFEIHVEGVPWRFLNEGNRDAFVKAREIYAPRFSGYCPYALSLGHPAEGDPELFDIHEGRLYLFATPGHRSAFRAAPAGTLAGAAERWATVAAELPR